MRVVEHRLQDRLGLLEAVAAHQGVGGRDPEGRHLRRQLLGAQQDVDDVVVGIARLAAPADPVVVEQQGVVRVDLEALAEPVARLVQPFGGARPVGAGLQHAGPAHHLQRLDVVWIRLDPALEESLGLGAVAEVVLGAGQDQVGQAIAGIAGGTFADRRQDGGPFGGRHAHLQALVHQQQVVGRGRQAFGGADPGAGRRPGHAQSRQLLHVALERAFQVGQGHARRRGHLVDRIAAGRHRAGIGGQALQPRGVGHHVVGQDPGLGVEGLHVPVAALQGPATQDLAVGLPDAAAQPGDPLVGDAQFDHVGLEPRGLEIFRIALDQPRRIGGRRVLAHEVVGVFVEQGAASPILAALHAHDREGVADRGRIEAAHLVVEIGLHLQQVEPPRHQIDRQRAPLGALHHPVQRAQQAVEILQVTRELA